LRVTLIDFYVQALRQAGFSLDQPSFLTTCQVCSDKTYLRI
jgi:hypothetical protein